MCRPRHLPTHEVFYLKDRLLMSLAAPERWGLALKPDDLKSALQEVWPTLLQLACIESSFTLSKEQQVSRTYQLSSDQLTKIKAYHQHLLSWSQHYLDSVTWYRMKDVIRHKRREPEPNWLTQLRSALGDQVKPEKNSRWTHPLKGKDRFASKLLVPHRLSSKVA